MTYEECRNYVDANLDYLLKVFGLPQWRVVVTYRDLDGCKAQITPSFEYEKAFLEIDPFKFDCCKELWETLEHELCHVVHSPLQLVSQSAQIMLDDTGSRVISLAFDKGQEMTVRNMERMIFGIRKDARTTAISIVERQFAELCELLDNTILGVDVKKALASVIEELSQPPSLNASR